jgi:hypothetical protein
MYPQIERQKMWIGLSFPGILYIAPAALYISVVLSTKKLQVKLSWLRIGIMDSLSAVLLSLTVVPGWGQLVKIH